MILKRLRRETSELHLELERQLALTDVHLSRDAYVGILARFYGYYQPLETQLSTLASLSEIGFEFSERQKVPHLEMDLRVLGRALELPSMPRCAALPPLDSIPRTLGCLYVVEGATLGGTVISRHLAANLGITPRTGGAFFAGYESETGAKWQAFQVIIRTATDKFGGADEIVASANRTFAAMGAWLPPSCR